MLRALKIFHLGFLCVLVLGVLAQGLFVFLPEQKLFGALTSLPQPHFSVSSWMSGSFQKASDEWAVRHVGFRSYLIKTENQVNLSLFHTLSSQSGTPMVFGKNGYLFEKDAINTYRKTDRAPVATLEESVVRLRQLQDYLQQHGKLFLFVLAPNKAMVNPEYLPAAYAKKLTTSEGTNYEKIRPLLQKYNINTLDVEHFFETLKSSSPYPLFVRGGTHWSRYGACIAAQALRDSLALQTPKKLFDLSCDPVTTDYLPSGIDQDLARLTNIWGSRSLVGLTPHPSIQITAPRDAFRPSVLFVGDSFVWSILDTLKSPNTFSSPEFYYYYSKQGLTDTSLKEIDKKNLDWEKNIFSKDALIIEASMSALPTIGFGFAEDALKHIK